MTIPRLEKLVAQMRDTYSRGPGINDLQDALPDRESVAKVCTRVLAILFPGFFTAERISKTELDTHTMSQLMDLQSLLLDQVARALRYSARVAGKAKPANLVEHTRGMVLEQLDLLAHVRELVSTDVEAAFNNDPAALDRETIVLSYPSIEALAVQRFAHGLYRAGIPIIPRMMTEVAHSHTGIDIHPGATIDESFFIDHGTGVVIGETCTIGKRCVLYHGVTLGAWNPIGAKDENGDLKRGSSNKRHPDLEDKVTVYPGATILGGDTKIGHHSIIGGNVWLTHSVEPYTLVTIKDPELMIRKRKVQPSMRVSSRIKKA
ncbi:MAG: serine acetyltransferase [Planctomycetes bacterium]|nr:serine acetyltransferase [Planctomycetota bacterium]